MLPMWFVAGVVLSLVHLASIVVLVGTMSLDEGGRVRRRVRRSYILRYLSLGVLLTFALRQGLAAGLFASLGFFVGRWLAVYLCNSRRIDWQWFGP
ncbi:MAG: hypothetical protein ACP5HG_07595 [Anaerolineae bacterium]